MGQTFLSHQKLLAFKMADSDINKHPPISAPLTESYDPEMEAILKAMVDADEEITARGVIRRHSTLRAASSITRNPNRSAMLATYAKQQEGLREWRKALAKKSKDSAAMTMADKDVRIAELARQVEILTLSHVAMLRAVGELGGFPKWAKFYESFQSVRNELVNMKAISDESKTTIKNNK